jgi:hypothetical protein
MPDRVIGWVYIGEQYSRFCGVFAGPKSWPESWPESSFSVSQQGFGLSIGEFAGLKAGLGEEQFGQRKPHKSSRTS